MPKKKTPKKKNRQRIKRNKPIKENVYSENKKLTVLEMSLIFFKTGKYALLTEGEILFYKECLRLMEEGILYFDLNFNENDIYNKCWY